MSLKSFYTLLFCLSVPLCLTAHKALLLQKSIQTALEKRLQKPLSVQLTSPLPLKPKRWKLQNIICDTQKQTFCAEIRASQTNEKKMLNGQFVLQNTKTEKEVERLPVFLEKGAPVMLIYQKKRMNIRAHGGKLLKRSKIGDTVQVSNPFRKRAKPVLGRLVDRSTVVIP
ncbi:MAG: hypothetical protein V6Z78_00670 [Holosporaceae bacterium]